MGMEMHYEDICVPWAGILTKETQWVRWPILWMPVHLFPYVVPNGCEKSKHGSRDAGYAWAQQLGLSFTKINLLAAEDKTESPLWHQFQTISQPPGIKLFI